MRYQERKTYDSAFADHFVFNLLYLAQSTSSDNAWYTFSFLLFQTLRVHVKRPTSQRKTMIGYTLSSSKETRRASQLCEKEPNTNLPSQSMSQGSHQSLDIHRHIDSPIAAESCQRKTGLMLLFCSSRRSYQHSQRVMYHEAVSKDRSSTPSSQAMTQGSRQSFNFCRHGGEW